MSFSALPTRPSWELSLNGKAPLASLDTSALSSLGVCGGDLIYIIDSQQSPPPVVAFQATATQLDTPAAAASSTTAEQASAMAAPCRDVSMTAAGLMETAPDSASAALAHEHSPTDHQDPNLIQVLTALSNYGFHLPASTSALELLSHGTLQALEVCPSFSPSTTVHVKLVAMGGQLCVHARWQHGSTQGRVVSVVLPCLAPHPSISAAGQQRRKLQVRGKIWLAQQGPFNGSSLPDWSLPDSGDCDYTFERGWD